jgi:hypothetical protein
MSKLPAFQFYPGDWRKDPGVQSLSFHDRGVWFEILLLMHESDERGRLLLNGKKMPEDALARLLGLDNQILTTTLTTLLTYGVASVCEETGCIVCRRMVRDEQLREVRKKAGKLGGNPNLVNQKVKQKPTTKVNQKSTPSSSSSSSSSTSVKNIHPRKIIPPKLEDVRAYCAERGNQIDPEQFVDYNDSKGWIVGKTKMQDWQAAIRTWEKNGNNNGQQSYQPRLTANQQREQNTSDAFDWLRAAAAADAAEQAAQGRLEFDEPSACSPEAR